MGVVVFFHRFFKPVWQVDDCLYHALLLCRRFTKGRVVLLSSGKSEEELNRWVRGRDFGGIEFLPIEKFQDGLFEKFERLYVHMHTGPLLMDRSSIDRWFIFRNLISDEEGVLLDSDHLAFSDPLGQWCGKDLYTYFGRNPTPFICHKKLVLDLFCQWVVQVYSERGEEFSRLERMWKSFSQAGNTGGVCDMTLWGRFRELYTDFSAGHPFELRDSGVWDDNWGISEIVNVDMHEYPFEDRFIRAKKVVWENGLPYFCVGDARIRALGLHLSGWPRKLLSWVIKNVGSP